MRHLTEIEVEDSTPKILAAIADAIGSDDPTTILRLVECAPAQGLSRLALHFDVIEVMQEDRLLREVVVRHVESAMGRRMDVPESAALHAAIDLMLQRSVIALVDAQKARLRAAAETELRFLAFLSHDLNNNLGNVRLSLEVLRRDLGRAGGGGFPEIVASLLAAQRSVDDTASGMRRMLEHERLRKAGKVPSLAQVDLAALAAKVVRQFAERARHKGVRLDVDVQPGTLVRSDGELLTLVLQNLVGNGVKYSTAGTVRITAAATAAVDDGDGAEETAAATGLRTVVSVSDEGPGIAADQLVRIFAAFQRGEVHGQEGVGLGLAIASQAANLLGADLAVTSRVGAGSTFRITLPPARAVED